MLKQNELVRYDRQLGIDGIGIKGQEKLKAATILVVGAGGLGSASLTYLAAAGIGTIRIIDCDRVEMSNLNRQILHHHEDIGRKKTESAKEKLEKLNPDIHIDAVDDTVTESNVSGFTAGVDLIVDALDNLHTRYILNRAAIENTVPFFHGAVSQFEGRIMTIIPKKTACLYCLYHGRDPEKKTPVIGVTPAIIGNLQATEVIKYILGIGRLFTDRLLVYDGLHMKFLELTVQKNPHCPHCGTPSRP